jgi:small basic protein
LSEGTPAPDTPFGRWDLAFAVLALAGGAVLLYLGRSLTFWFDEWRSIAFDGGLLDYLRPVNEHWSTLPLALYRATFSIVELRSYVPYLSEVVGLHLVAVSGAYLLLRRRIGPVGATIAALPLLLLGAGSENFFWAFQTGFVGSVMFGVWALWFVERPGRSSGVVSALLLIAGLMSSGMGLFFVVAVLGRTILDAERRKRMWVVVPAIAAYIAWFATLGHDAVGDESSLAGPLHLARFVARGLGHATEAMIGLDLFPGGLVLGFAVFAGLVVATTVGLLRSRGVFLAAGCLLGLAAMYTIVGSVRASLDDHYELRSRYTYVAAFFLVLVVVDLFAARPSTSRVGTRWRTAIAVAVVVVYALSLSSNLQALSATRARFEYQARLTRTYVALALMHGNEQWIDQDVMFNLMPPVRDLASVVERFGYGIDPHDVAKPGERAFDAAVLLLVGDRFRVERATSSGERVRLGLVDSSDLVATSSRGCVRGSSAGGQASATVSVPGGTRVDVSADSEVTGTVGVGYTPAVLRYASLRLKPRSVVDVVVPYVGRPRWLLVVTLPGLRGRVTLCAHRDNGPAA